MLGTVCRANAPETWQHFRVLQGFGEIASCPACDDGREGVTKRCRTEQNFVRTDCDVVLNGGHNVASEILRAGRTIDNHPGLWSDRVALRL